MPCKEFEDLLIDYRELTREQRQSVDTHIATCPGCKASLQALTNLDTALTERFAGLEVPTNFHEKVFRLAYRQRQTLKPTRLPEVLDFVGWAAVVAIAVGLLNRVIPWDRFQP